MLLLVISVKHGVSDKTVKYLLVFVPNSFRREMLNSEYIKIMDTKRNKL